LIKVTDDMIIYAGKLMEVACRMMGSRFIPCQWFHTLSKKNSKLPNS